MAPLVEAWPGVVGEAIAQNAWPARLGRDGVLHVSVSSSSWAFELTQLSTELEGRLRDALGNDAPVRLRFAVGPLPEAPAASEDEQAQMKLPPSPAARAEAERLATPIEDEELRKLVAQAAAASLAKAESDRRFW
jgi:hypothetical protein